MNVYNLTVVVHIYVLIRTEAIIANVDLGIMVRIEAANVMVNQSLMTAIYYMYTIYNESFSDWNRKIINLPFVNSEMIPFQSS